MDDLFKLVSQFSTTIVYGNLGRRPPLVHSFLTQNFSHFNILIVSKYYSFRSGDNVHVVTPEEARSKPCDLLVYIEPPPYTNVTVKPRQAARLLILTSHLVLTLPKPNDSWTLVTYFHETNPEHVQKLLTLQDASWESSRIDAVKLQIDFFPVVSLGPTASDLTLGNVMTPPLPVKSYILINLTQTFSPMAMMLHFWDAFDYMAEQEDKIQGWLICFPEKGVQPFLSFTQECIDQLFCKPLETPLAELLALVPFYKSGITVDGAAASSQETRDRFCDLEYVAPDSIERLLTMLSKENLDHLAGNVYLIK